MKEVITIGVDLAKNVFPVHGVDAERWIDHTIGNRHLTGVSLVGNFQVTFYGGDNAN